MKTLTVKLPDQLFDEIHRTALYRKVPKSEIVRERLAHNQGAGGSLWDRMQDLVISNDSLSRDLSSNKAHLENMAKTVLIDSGAIVA